MDIDDETEIDKQRCRVRDIMRVILAVNNLIFNLKIKINA